MNKIYFFLFRRVGTTIVNSLGVFGVLDSQSVLRMINLLAGMLHISVTKEQLMD